MAQCSRNFNLEYLHLKAEWISNCTRWLIPCETRSVCLWKSEGSSIAKWKAAGQIASRVVLVIFSDSITIFLHRGVPTRAQNSIQPTRLPWRFASPTGAKIYQYRMSGGKLRMNAKVGKPLTGKKNSRKIHHPLPFFQYAQSARWWNFNPRLGAGTAVFLH